MIVPNDYEDPHVFRENTMLDRAYYIPASDRFDRAAEHREESDRFQLLNGSWRFQYYQSLRELNEPFYRMDFDPSDFDLSRFRECGRTARGLSAPAGKRKPLRLSFGLEGDQV